MSGKLKRRLYIEQKTDGNRFLNHRGPATISELSLSNSGRTVYYNGLSLKRPASNMTSCVHGNYYATETGDEYWVTGVKKGKQKAGKKRGGSDHPNRHWSGGGAVTEAKE